MSELKEFRLPDVGEGLTEAEIVAWHVKPGDTVTDGQVIVEIETAKAVVELPCPFAGTVTKLLVDEGQTVDVGAPIIAVEVAGNGPAAPAPATDAPPERTAVLVGYGVMNASTKRRQRRGVTEPPATQVTAEVAEAFGTTDGAVSAVAAAPASEARGATSKRPAASSPKGLAKPPVRKLAKDLGIDLAGLAGTGPSGSITRDDVQRAAAGSTSRSDISVGSRVPIRGVRKHMAAAMVASAFTAPHVTEFLQVDVTETMAAVRRVRELPEFEGLRVSPLLFVARALLTAVARHPMVNSSWDEAAQEILVHGQVNLGIAVAAERGLIVPNVKDAGSLTLPSLAGALQALTETARAGKATPADLSGGTITITNVGVFGIDAGTPILTPGEAAILAFGQVRDAPWVVDGQLAVRKVCTLSLSFDHRILDGELGSAALRDVGLMLEDPLRMLAWS
ncbi:MAG TPA: dihydrolipoamide acetyltransferase family protein [Streptosporangiaceae bacterium]|nr:dihydrolipoamide acetyltransferase family protein [Streptosporangiaceae bacterium]